MSRGLVPGLRSPSPIGLALPGVYQEDALAQAFTGAADDCLAPLLSVLDCLEAYVDPWLAPEDLLPWLAGWVGVRPDDAPTPDRLRALVAGAVGRHARRGTPGGLRDLLALGVEGEVEVEDSGGTAWSAVPGGPPPGSATAGVRVRVRVAGGDLDGAVAARARALATEAVPVGVPLVVEVVGTSGAGGAGRAEP